MKKWKKAVLCCLALAALIQLGTLIRDKLMLRNDLIRLHVVANSDTAEDQAVKLQVRDAIIAYLEPMSAHVSNQEEAKQYLNTRIRELTQVTNSVLQENGSDDEAVVTLREECFDTRVYDTFTLPAGVYESLRVEIGDGDGKNWWCVVFPSFCLGATTQQFQDTAASAGFDDTLTDTLTGKEGYEIRFFFLDCLGRLENFFQS